MKKIISWSKFLQKIISYQILINFSRGKIPLAFTSQMHYNIKKGERRKMKVKCNSLHVKSTNTTYGFWPSFPKTLCWMGEALACGVYCGSIALVTKIGGAACSLACGGLFLVACNNAP